MSSQLPSPATGRPAADMPAEDDPTPQPEFVAPAPLRAISQWYHGHPAVADVFISLGIIVLNVLLGVSILLHKNGPVDAQPMLPLTFVTLGLAGAVLALRRRFPVWVWAAILVIPETHYLALTRIYHLNLEQLGFAANGVGLLTQIGLPIVLGTVASHRRPAVAWTTWTITLVALTVEISITQPDSSLEQIVRNAALYLLIMTIGTLVGLNTRSARLRLKALEARSARLALASEQGALLAAAEERSRIAREMHDVVAHSLAVMITMADGAAATVERNPATAKQAMKTLAEAGRSALADTRRLVGVLREDPSVAGDSTTAPGDSTSSASSTGSGSTESCPDDVPQTQSAAPSAATPSEALVTPRRPRWKPGRRKAAPRLSAVSAPSARGREVRDVPVPEFAPLGTVAPVEPSAPIANLRQQATDGGGDRSRGDLPLAPAPEQADITILVKRFETAGVPVSYRWNGSALPADKALQLTVFRIAQEALTNVLRYAPTTSAVSVDVERHIGTVVLTVDNEAAPGTRPMHGSGKGLIGMRERASVYGGTVQAGPTLTGWRVRAVLRWDEHDEGTPSWQMPL